MDGNFLNIIQVQLINLFVQQIPHRKEAMSNLKADILKLAKGNVYEEHEKFMKNFDPKWRLDENIILIMCAIALFSPHRAQTVHSDVIKLEQVVLFFFFLF